MTSRQKERARLIRRSQLKEEDLLPEDVNYGAWGYLRDPSMGGFTLVGGVTPVELIILWKFGYIRPSTSVVFLVMFPFTAGFAVSVVGLLLYGYIFLIPLSIHIAILILAITPMLLESQRTHLSIGTIASLKSRDRSRQINMAFVAVVLVMVILLFALIDSGVFEDGARLRITVESTHVLLVVEFNVHVEGSLVESGTLEPSQSTTFNHVYRWSFPEPTNVTISVQWTFLVLSNLPSMSTERTITAIHGESYTVNFSI